MASIRRTLSPVPRAGALLNGEVCSVASPLSKSSSCAQNHPSSGGLLSSLFGSLDSQAFVVGVFSPRSSRTLERSKPKGQVWRRALFHFFLCFVVGVFIGVTPFVSMNLSMNMSKHQAFSFEQIPTIGNFVSYDNEVRNVASLDSGGLRNNATLESEANGKELIDGIGTDELDNQSLTADSNLTLRKLLIIVTPMYLRPFHAYYLNRLAQTLKLVPPPLLWLVVEMTSQSLETGDMLRKSGVMYRHLVCSKNFTDTKDRIIHQRNVALSHIETHRLDGIVYFADDDNIYSVELFEQMRNIRRFGTWMVAKWPESKRKTIVEGPICNGTQVIGWHIDEPIRRFRRFHTEMWGFAFNSTILWDPKRWHRPTLESIRQLHTVKEGFQVSTFVEQVVEDENQMEGLMQNCSRIRVWHLHLESFNSFYPRMWFMKNNLDVIVPLA